MIRSLGALAMLGWLSGCAGGFAGFGGGGVDQLPLLGGAVIAAGPDAYCVDANTSKPVAGFAVMTACAVIVGEGDLPMRLAVLTVQAGPAQSAGVNGSETVLVNLLRSEAGVALLGQPSKIEVRDIRRSPNLVVVNYVDDGVSPIPGTNQQTWRAFTDINGHLVTVSLRSLAIAPLSPAAAETLLMDALDRLWQVNSVSVASEA